MGFAVTPIRHEMPSARHVLPANSCACTPPARQRASVGSCAMISSAAAAKMSNRRAEPDVVTATFSRIRFAKFGPAIALVPSR